MATMKAIAAKAYGAPEVLTLLEVPKPTPRVRDLIVQIKAVSVNPVDAKKRNNYRVGGGQVEQPLEKPIILGFDGAGVVVEVGSEAKLFKVGDEVYFAGVINRDGTNAQYTAVDERIVGRKPKNFTWEQAAAVPLTGLTAWEGLECQLGLKPFGDNGNKTILVIAGAGGVGSMVIPLAKKVFNLRVIATASRPETIDYVKQIGADYVINHRENIQDQLKAIGFEGVDLIFNNVNNDENFAQIAPSLNPFGRIVAITGANKPIDLSILFRKCASLSYELMFTRGTTGVDIEKQHEILNNIADLVEKGSVPDRASKPYYSLTKDLALVHTKIEQSDTIGKLVLTVDF